MSLSEEGSIVYCIGEHPENRSTFFEGSAQKVTTSNLCILLHTRALDLTRQSRHGFQPLGGYGPAMAPRGWVRALGEVEGNDFSAHPMHCVELIWRTPG